MKKADVILIISIVIFSAAAYVLIINTRTEGNTVDVVVDGETVAEFPLDEDITYEIPNEYGSNVLVIENGEAYMIEADCPDQICVEHAGISKSGETIICLPHRIVIRVNGSDEAGVDGVLN